VEVTKGMAWLRLFSKNLSLSYVTHLEFDCPIYASCEGSPPAYPVDFEVPAMTKLGVTCSTGDFNFRGLTFVAQ
jgi:hypothetical protein